MQEIAYRVDADDVVAFNVHVTENARGFRQLLLTVAVVVAMALYWMVSAGSDTTIPALITAAAGAAIYLVAAPRLLRLAVGRIVRRRLTALGSRLLGDHELAITPSTLRSRSDDAESETLLASISDVVRVGDRAFIYLTRDTAYILPREGVRSGDFDGFVDALRLAMVSARN